MRSDIHVPELWESVPEEKIEVEAERHAEILKAVQELIISNVRKIRLAFEAEDGRRPATIQELMSAVNTARTEELEEFLSSKNKTLFFEDGYITVKF